MKNNLIIFLTFIGLIGLLSGCEKDGTNVVIADQVVKPTIVTIPNLTLSRATGTQTLKFVGTFVNPGFTASANYFLEACAKGTNFVDPISIISSTQDTSLKITVSDLNSLLLKYFPGDAVSQVDFRIRSILIRDGGTGVTSLVYNSEIKTAAVTLYGLPRLDLTGSGITQKVESAIGDGKYFGYVKLDITKPFTLKDPDFGTVYGGTGEVLAVNGAAITIPADPGSGWYKLTADTKALTYKMDPYRVGVIGSSTPNGWDTPDTKMDYNPANGTWSITLDLKVGAIKFRLNDNWSATAGFNLGLGDATHPGYSLTNLWNDGGSKDIPIDAAGNYTLTLSVGSKYSCTIKKN